MVKAFIYEAEGCNRGNPLRKVQGAWYTVQGICNLASSLNRVPFEYPDLE
jgi:hypothetical protein